MASTIAALTTGGGGIVQTADASGNLSLLSGDTTIVAMTATGATITGALAVSGTGALTLPVGTTAQRPTPVTGMTRFNSTSTATEYYNGSAWVSSSGSDGAPLGTPASGNLTNCTFPTLNQNTSGTAATATTALALTSGAILNTPASGNLTNCTGVPARALPAGSVLQVVSYLTATQGSQTLSGTDSIINGITKIITPIRANSMFLVTARWIGEVPGAWDALFNIHMNGVRVNVGGQGRGYGLATPSQSYVVDDNNSTPETVNISTLVSTSSVAGTPITFSLVADYEGTATLWNNRCFAALGGNYEKGTSELIITEIGG
jgi:hypothetical protein